MGRMVTYGLNNNYSCCCVSTVALTVPSQLERWCNTIEHTHTHTHTHTYIRTYTFNLMAVIAAWDSVYSVYPSQEHFLYLVSPHLVFRMHTSEVHLFSIHAHTHTHTHIHTHTHTLTHTHTHTHIHTQSHIWEDTISGISETDLSKTK